MILLLRAAIVDVLYTEATVADRHKIRHQGANDGVRRPHLPEFGHIEHDLLDAGMISKELLVHGLLGPSLALLDIGKLPLSVFASVTLVVLYHG